MNKRILVCSALAAVAVGTVSLRSYGQTTPAPVTCHTVFRSYAGYAPTIAYDTRSGITVSGRSDQAYSFTGTVPLAVDGEPNPHFDRLYALLLKGAEGRLDQVCIDGASGTSGAVVSLKLLGATPSTAQKVQICGDGDDCADVYGGNLFVRDTSSR